MKKIAITGGIGSGKSTVLNLFKEKGYQTIQMDMLAKTLLNHENKYFKEYVKELNQTFHTNLSDNLSIDRLYLNNVVMQYQNGYQTIADVIRPFLFALLTDEFQKNYDIYFFEVPLLIEMNFYHLFDTKILVTSNKDERIKRIQIRNPDWTKNEILKKINAQTSDSIRKKYCDFIIKNNSTIFNLQSQISSFENQLTNHKLTF